MPKLPLSRADALQLLMPIVDAIQFPLFLCSDAKAPTGCTIKGYGDFAYPVDPGLDAELKIKCKVIASGVNPKDAYIIFSTLGNLWALVSYDKAMDEVSLTLINKATDPHLDIEKCKGRTLKDVYDVILPSVVGMWIRETRNHVWSRLDEVADVGEATVAVSQDQAWPDHLGSAG
jgi:hypothetical protein